jgi:hypothetical protein
VLSLEEEYEKILPVNKVKAKFSIAHVILTLFLFDIHGRLGRVELEKQLGLGRGSLRTLVSRLKDGLGLIKSESTRAHVLTKKGIDTVRAMKQEFNLIGNLPVIFDQWCLEDADFNALGHLVMDGLSLHEANELPWKELLEISKRAGEKGSVKGSVMLFVDRGRVLKLLFIEKIKIDVKKEYTEEWLKINEIFPLNAGNIILISFADREIDAKLAVIAIALALEKKVKNS